MTKRLLRDLIVSLLLLAALEGAARLWSQPTRLAPGFALSMTVHHVLAQLDGAPASFLPLGGQSRRPTWLCEETSGPITFAADRHGFNNDDAEWDREPDTVLLGDSFIQGYCVKPEQQLAQLVRARGERVLNLGLKGTGPLSQLGVLEEYALAARPKRIAWFVLANDLLYDLQREIKQPILVDYLAGRTQSLSLRQAEIDSRLAEIGAGQTLPAGPALAFPDALLRFAFSLLRLDPIRPLDEGISSAAVDDRSLALVADVYARGSSRARELGARVDFVFVPDSWLFAKKEGPEVRALIGRLKSAMAAKGLALADPTQTFDATGEPFRYFAPLDGRYGHYNADGFRVLAEAVPPL